MSSVYSRSVTLEIEGDSVIKYFITWIFFKAIYYVYDSFLKVIYYVCQQPRELSGPELGTCSLVWPGVP